MLTGNPNPRISPMSLNRPFTTTPAAPRTFARAAMSPPKQAEGRLGGWEMNMILPGALESAKWVGGVGAAVEVVGTIWVVGWGVRGLGFACLVKWGAFRMEGQRG